MFVFKAAFFTSLALLAAGQQSCPNSQWTYDAASRMCYFVGKTSLQTFYNSYVMCAQQGGQLAVVHNVNVQNIITALAQNADPDFYYWIGLALNGEGQFSWIDGTILDYFRWCPNYPAAGGSNQCGVLDSKANCWRNINCNTLLPFICTYNPSLTTTTTMMITTTATGSVNCNPDNYPQGQGMVYSPGYPGAYGNNEDCNYLLSANTNGQVYLQIVSFNTETCCDKLYIYDGPTRFSPLIQSLAGTPGTPSFTSSGQFMTLRFTTDSSVVGPGFTARYSTVYGTTSMRPTVGK